MESTIGLEKQNGPTPLETLNQHAEIAVTLAAGGTETVRVKQVGFDELKRYAELQDDEGKQADFLCNKPDGWHRTLVRGSVEAIIVEGDRLNADFFARWMRRRIEKQERAMPGLLDRAVASVLPKPAEPRANGPSHPPSPRS